MDSFLTFLNGLQSYWSGSTSKTNKFSLEHKILSCILISNVYPMILSARLVQHFWTKCKIVILKKIFFLHFFTFGKISKSCILKLPSIQKHVLVMDLLRWNTKRHFKLAWLPFLVLISSLNYPCLYFKISILPGSLTKKKKNL